jgi:acetyltransferase
MIVNNGDLCWPLPAGLRPPGYPAEYERIVDLADGRRAFVRPIAPHDAVALRQEIRDADPDTLFRRFFTTQPRIDSRRLQQLCALDYRWRFALIAVDENGAGIGIARYEGEPHRGHAEVAMVTRPAWRRLGLAATLIGLLEEAARARGLSKFCASYLPDNDAAAATLAKSGFGQPRVSDGVAEVDKSLA